MAIKRITTNLIKDSDIATVDIANNAITAAKITDGNITTAKLADLSVTAGKLAGTLDLTGKTITVATATTGDSDTSPASTAFVQQEIAALVDSSPSSLNTLNELAAALGDDASFSTTVTNSIATKLPLAGGTMTGDLKVGATIASTGGTTNSRGMLLAHQNNTNQSYVGRSENGVADTGNRITFDYDNDKMQLDSDGDIVLTPTSNVGIGTTSPNTTLTLSDGTDEFDFGVTTNQLLIKSVTSDGSDDQRIIIDAGNGGLSSTRGAYISLSGNEASAEPGHAIYQMGNVTGSAHVFRKAGGNDAVTIDSSGNVGIGTDSPVAKLDIRMSDSNGVYGRGRDGNLNLENTNTSVTEGGWLSISGYMGNTANSGQYQMGYISGGKQTTAADGDYGGYLTFWTTSGGANGEANSGGYERMRINSSGNVGIGETSPSKLLHIASDTNYEGMLIKGAGHKQITIESTQSSKQALVTFTTASQNMSIGLETDNSFIFHSGTASAERMRIDSSGKVGINSTTMDATLNTYAGGTNLKAAMFQGLGGNKLSIAPYISTGAFSSLSHTNDIAIIAESAGGIVIAHHASGNKGIRIVNNGDLEVGGALSKASGSFRIDHPLESKKDTHQLVHSFVEAPQADNIYRGVVVLENGSATINIDTVSGMTEGTFVLLNTNTSCFTSNESDWDAVKGSVSGNILTISCQNSSSTATVSWLVIGERHDQHMLDTEWTNENGKVIVEPLKRVIEDE